MKVVRKKKSGASSTSFEDRALPNCHEFALSLVSPIRPLKIDVDRIHVEELLAHASECERYLMDEQTLALISICGLGTPFSSLIFIRNGQVFKSRETTSRILNRFEKQMGFSRELVSSTYQHYLGKRYRSPYGIGQLLFFPKSSTSHKRHQHWFAYHHLLQYDYSNDQLMLYYPNQLTLTYQGNKRGARPYFSYLDEVMQLKSNLSVLMKTWLAVTTDARPQPYDLSFQRHSRDEDPVVDGFEGLFSTLSEKFRREALRSVAQDLDWELEDLEQSQE